MSDAVLYIRFRSLSYIVVLSSMAFLLMTAFYDIIDVYHLWTGAPFTYLGTDVMLSLYASYFLLLIFRISLLLILLTFTVSGLALIHAVLVSCQLLENLDVQNVR